MVESIITLIIAFGMLYIAMVWHNVMLGFIGGMVLSCAIELANEVLTPSALDVYRGKTRLEITTVNGVPTDTVVVFK